MGVIGKTICNICNEKIDTNLLEEHGNKEHPGYFLNVCGRSREFKEKKYWCPLDNNWHASRKWLVRKAIKPSGMSNEEYFLTYGEKYMPDDWKIDPKYGTPPNKNTCLQCDKVMPFDEQHWEYPIFCSFPCSTTWHAKNTDRVARAEQTKKKLAKENPDFCLIPTQVRYWTNKGLSDEEAKQKVKERQTTNTKDAFIKRAGGDIEEGSRMHAERQKKWLKSMQKSGMYTGVSKVCDNLFEIVSKTIPEIKFGASEIVVRLSDRACKIDCIHREKKKIIEFYGDYWHGNPIKYGPDSLIRKRKTAKQKWEEDRIRIQDLNEAGYETLIIWEMDYKKEPEEVIKKCIDFLRS